MWFRPQPLCIYIILYTQSYLYIVYCTLYLSYLTQYIIILIYIMPKSFPYFSDAFRHSLHIFLANLCNNCTFYPHDLHKYYTKIKYFYVAIRTKSHFVTSTLCTLSCFSSDYLLYIFKHNIF